jgi:GxxExxY protein
VDCAEELTARVIGAAVAVHRHFGPGLLESVYEAALGLELQDAGLSVRRQVAVPACYRQRDLGLAFRADIVVNDSLLLELKTVDQVTNTHRAQVITYLKLLNIKRGLLINFNQAVVKDGIHRLSI